MGKEGAISGVGGATAWWGAVAAIVGGGVNSGGVFNL